MADKLDPKAGAPPETASRGTLERGIILEELRIAFVPIAKAACTSLRWLISDLVGLPEGSFEDPAKFRATQGQTIQNVHKWPPQYVIQCADPGWLEGVVKAEDWFRFSVVRDPARRLWSAWQSKLLLRAPAFVQKFGGEPWFPDIPSTPEEVLESYEQFVAALDREDEERRPYDTHWASQTGLLGDALPALNHIGRVETLGDTLDLLGDHVARFGLELPEMRRENVTPLSYPDGLLSEETLRIVHSYYAADYRAFGYPEPGLPLDAEDRARKWRERTGILLPSVRIFIAHNERLTTLDNSLQEARHQAAKALKEYEGLHQKIEKRDEQVARLRGRVNALKGRVRSLREALQEMEQSSTWRYTAPLRSLISEAKRVKGRLQERGKSG